MSENIWDTWKDKRYAHHHGYLKVCGYIDKPALILINPMTGQKETVIIDCPNHKEMREITEGEALGLAEHFCFTK